MSCPAESAELPIDQLEKEIITLSKRVNAAEFEFLMLVREFDVRKGWKSYQFNHCADWLNYKCGISPNTAREKVRVANALCELPLMSAAFQSGELPYSKARAMTRVATPETEEALLTHAMSATAEQVENRCRAIRNGLRDLSTQDANSAHEKRFLSRRKHADGSMTITVELPQESGELVMLALEKAVAVREREDGRANVDSTNDSPTDPPKRSAQYFAGQADALVDIARTYLAGGSDNRTSNADHYQVMVHVDERVLAASAGNSGTSSAPDVSAETRGTTETQTLHHVDTEIAGEAKAGHCDMPIETIRRICCDTSLVAVVEDENGDPVSTSRKHRTAQPALRRALVARDKCCRFPGCSHDKWLDVHHIHHWIDGGETSKDNTLLLCSKHHRMLHEGGYSIHQDDSGGVYFETSDGRILPEFPIPGPEHPPDRRGL